MSNQIPVGKKIRLARVARELTAREFAARLGMTHGWVSQVETGQNRLNLDIYQQIQAALGFDFDSPEAKAAFDFFLGGTNDTN